MMAERTLNALVVGDCSINTTNLNFARFNLVIEIDIRHAQIDVANVLGVVPRLFGFCLLDLQYSQILFGMYF